MHFSRPFVMFVFKRQGNPSLIVFCLWWHGFLCYFMAGWGCTAMEPVRASVAVYDHLVPVLGFEPYLISFRSVYGCDSQVGRAQV